MSADQCPARSHLPHALQCMARTVPTASCEATYSAISGLEAGNRATPAGRAFPLQRRRRPTQSSLQASGPKCFRNVSSSPSTSSSSGVIAGRESDIICLDSEFNYPLFVMKLSSRWRHLPVTEIVAVNHLSRRSFQFFENESRIALERDGRRILALPTVGTPRRRLTFIEQGRAEVARQAHNLKVDGSNPSPASNFHESRAKARVEAVAMKDPQGLAIGELSRNPEVAKPSSDGASIMCPCKGARATVVERVSRLAIGRTMACSAQLRCAPGNVDVRRDSRERPALSQFGACA
jgi:hypothetical protein